LLHFMADNWSPLSFLWHPKCVFNWHFIFYGVFGWGSLWQSPNRMKTSLTCPNREHLP
jgi:hypothetical protein